MIPIITYQTLCLKIYTTWQFLSFWIAIAVCSQIKYFCSITYKHLLRHILNHQSQLNRGMKRWNYYKTLLYLYQIRSTSFVSKISNFQGLSLLIFSALAFRLFVYLAPDWLNWGLVLLLPFKTVFLQSVSLILSNKIWQWWIDFKLEPIFAPAAS